MMRIVFVNKSDFSLQNYLRKINMSFNRICNFVYKLPRTCLVPSRNVSEYAKRMGYKIVEEPASTNLALKNALYITGSAFLLYIVISDKRAHYEVYTKHAHELKHHFHHRTSMDPAVLPNMDFFFKNLEED